jgi:hypothetical protein
VHLDWHVGPYAKAILDETFGSSLFRNEIVWQRTASHNDPKRFGVVHDTIYFYSREATWNPPKMAQDQGYIDQFFVYAETPDGSHIKLAKGEDAPAGLRRFRLGNFASPSPRPNLTYEYKGYKPPANGWKVARARMEELDAAGRLFFPSSLEGRIQTKSYLEEVIEGKPVPDVWLGMMALQGSATENVDYATQKPEALLSRIISASSNPGDLVLDCFAGSGTTAAVAEKLGRRWITADLGRFAIHTTRKRLLAIPDVKPFAVQNLGKYERQAWQAAEFGEREDIEARQYAYRNFILQLYKAEPVEASQWIHGRKSGRWVHVGAVDSPISTQDVTAIANSLKQLNESGNRVDVLGWDFAFDLNETAKQQAARAGLDFSFKIIPREVLEKRAVEQGDIQFFELGALGVDHMVADQKVEVRLTDLIVRQDDIPAEVRGSITHWSQMLDYWAVDWDFRDDTFHNQWQSYRTRKDPKIALSAAHTYEEAGAYHVMVKAIDILGNDTTKVIEVAVP